MSSISLPRLERTALQPPLKRQIPPLDDLGIDAGEQLLSRAQLARITSAVAARRDVWEPRVRHELHRRWFELLHLSEAVEVWLIGWSVGQSTPLHDHGGAFGALTVTEGQLTEVEFSEGLGGRRRLRLHQAPATVAFGTHHLHRVGNWGQANATSIHAYSPANISMRMYDDVAPSLSAEVRSGRDASL